MKTIAHMIDMATTLFCAHEWASRHEPARWYLECVKCRATTPGIEIGPRGQRRAQAEPRRVLIPLARPTARAA